MEITEIGALLVKAETVYGTDPTPTGAANAIPTAGDQLTWDVESQYTPRRVIGANLDRIRGYNSLPNCTLKFRYELRGNRTTGTGASDISEGTLTYAIEIAPILAAADLNATYSAASPSGSRNGSVRYKPAWPGGIGSSVTCYWYTGTKVHKLVGGKADISLVVEPGKMAYLDVTIRGKYVAAVDAAIPGTLTYLTTKPPVCEGGIYTYTGGVGTWSPVLARLEFALGNQIVMRPNVVAANGVAGFVIAGRESTVRVLVEAEALSASDPFADLLTTVATVAHALKLGADTGNKFELDATGDVTKVSYQNDGPRRMYSIETSTSKNTPIVVAGNDVQLGWL